MPKTKVDDLVGKIINFRGTKALVTTEENSTTYVLAQFPFGELCKLDKNFGDCLERDNGKYDFPRNLVLRGLQPEIESFTRKEDIKRYDSLREQWNNAKTQTL